MRWLICWTLLIAVNECRHLSEDRRQSKRQQGGLVRHGGRRRQTDNVMVVEEDGREWTSDEYQPVVLKLEVHFQAVSNKRNKHKKRNQQQRIWSAKNRTSIIDSRSGSSGFIHLFLPISLPLATTSRPSTVATSLVSAAETTTATAATHPASIDISDTTTIKRVNSKNRKKKRKKKQQQHQPQQQQQPKRKKKKSTAIDQDDSNTMDQVDPDRDEMMNVGDERHKAIQQPSATNRLMPLLLQDDGIPPMLNSLSSDETQQWASWLRCTLCLKNDKNKQSDEESTLCQMQNVECRQANVTTENELTTSGCQEPDTCTQWQQCENSQDIPGLFAALPPCPCTYPTGLVYNDRVWDPLNRHHYRWREISLQSERVDIYRPGAAYCIRSLSVVPKMSLSSQQCCYDDRRRLLTRGWAAGTPALVSPEASAHLSRVTERLPWLACKGDFSRYHLQRPPDNRLNCSVNPSDEEYQRQVLLATNY